MKQLQRVLFLLLVCILFLDKNVVAQDTATTKEKNDTAEEIVIWCPSVSIDATFPGGEPSWQRFLARKLVYPKKAKRKKIEGIVTVAFVIGKDGMVCDAKVFSGPEELRQSAIDVVMKSPKWDPAVQNGRNVKNYKKSDIVFKLNRQ